MTMMIFPAFSENSADVDYDDDDDGTYEQNRSSFRPFI